MRRASVTVLALAFLLGDVVVAQNYSSILTNPTSTSDGALFTTDFHLTVEQMWDLMVGPVEKAAVTTTVSPTPVPTSSLIPPPPLYFPSFPSGQQIPLVTKNSSWSFPQGFWWGVAGAAYQIEGAVQDEGRGPSTWDVITHRVTDAIVGNVTGDIADNNYYLYKQGPVNEAGLAHYDDVINTCLKYGIKPTVTLYHWDTPLYLQNLYGGWLDQQIVADFEAYASIVFKRYGNRVSHWFTVNEPSVFCSFYPLAEGYFTPSSIPAQQQPFYCGQHVLLSHARAYHLGKSLGLNGTISFKSNGGYKVPLTSSVADAEAVQRAWDFTEGMWAHPIWLGGDYPASVKAYVSSFLPSFTAAQKAMINGTGDVFAHDAYTAQFYFAPDVGIDACVADPTNPLYPSCANTSYTYSDADGGWLIGPSADVGAPWLHKTTDWVPAFLHYIQDTWKPASIAVTEFGFAEPYEELKTLLPNILYDPIRMSYYHDYLEAILIAISEGVNVVGCLAWSIYDNLEWTSGYSTKFGMQYVNFTTQERYYKASFFEYVGMFQTYGA